METNHNGLPLSQRTSLELITQLRSLEARIRAHHSRGISNMSFLELFISRKLEMDAKMIRNELDSRTSSACI